MTHISRTSRAFFPLIYDNHLSLNVMSALLLVHLR
jgi:hypothetical protein